MTNSAVDDILNKIEKERRRYSASKQLTGLLFESDAILAHHKIQIELLEGVWKLFDELQELKTVELKDNV